MTEALITRLKRWAELSPPEEEALRTLPGELAVFARGDHPLRGTYEPGCTMLMVDGWAARYKDTVNGRRVIIEIMLPGDMTVWSPHQDPGLETVMVAGGSVLFVAPQAMEALRAHPAIRHGLEWIAKIREAIFAEWLVNIASRKAYARLAHLLCELSARMNSVGLLDHGECELPLTQVDLANALAMTNVHLNLALQRLRSAKLVKVSGKRLIILDRRELEAIADFDDQYLLRWPTELPDRRNQPRAQPVKEERRKKPWRLW